MKKIFIVTLVAIAATSSLYGIYNHTQKSELNSLILTNAEALSSSEIIVGWDKNCIRGGDGCCPNPYQWMPEDLPC